MLEKWFLAKKGLPRLMTNLRVSAPGENKHQKWPNQLCIQEVFVHSSSQGSSSNNHGTPTRGYSEAPRLTFQIFMVGPEPRYKWNRFQVWWAGRSKNAARSLILTLLGRGATFLKTTFIYYFLTLRKGWIIVTGRIGWDKSKQDLFMFFCQIKIASKEMLGISGRRWNQLPNCQDFTSFFFSLRLLLLLSPFCQTAAEPPEHPERGDSPAGSDGAAEADAEGAAASAQRPCTSLRQIHLNKCDWFHPHRVSGCISLTHDCPAFL